MARIVLPILALTGSLALTGCSINNQKPQRPAWREAAEKACFAQKRVQLSEYIQPRQEIDGPGICGLTNPLKVTALQGGQVRFNSTATLGCPMVAELDNWLERSVQPAAMQYFGQPIAQIDSMGSYSCRSMNNQMGARLSEHSFGNGLDIGGFTLTDGKKIVIRKDWTQGDEETKAFLRAVQAGACESFTTVLAPGSNIFHYDHIHVDLAQHGSSSRGLRRVCKPAPQNWPTPPRRDNLPDAPEVEEETDIAHAKTLPGSANSYAMHSAPTYATPSAPQYRAQANNPDLPMPPVRPANLSRHASAPGEEVTGSIRRRSRANE